MKSTGMPTSRNTAPVEDYNKYRERKTKSVVEKCEGMLTELANSSLTKEDKRKLSLELMKMCCP